VAAQLNENFSDGDFRNNPEWFGDTLAFRVNETQELQLHASDAGSYCLFTPNMLCDSAEWLFRVVQKFSPSGNNNTRIWLMRDESSPEQAFGYYLQLGEAGTADVPELFLFQEGVATSVCRCSGPDISGSSDFNYKITRTSEGIWEVGFFTKEGIWVVTGSGVSAVIGHTGSFGIHCTCTASNSTKFYFDNFQIRAIEYDLIPPEGYAAFPETEQRITAEFSEPIFPPSAEILSHYFLSPPGVTPIAAGIREEQNNCVTLLFEQSLADNTLYNLEISNLEDYSGNRMERVYLWFTYRKSRRGDLIITEIMADVNPVPPGLLAQEYLEIYNSTPHPISLRDYALDVNSRRYLFTENQIIEGGEYVVISEEKILDSVSTLFLPGLSLPNTTCQLLLWNNREEISYAMEYSATTHTVSKRDGGWSLEIIDPENFCAGAENWGSSIALQGGTPGYENSIAAVCPDTQKPILSEAFIFPPDTVVLRFNETIDPESLSLPEAFFIRPKAYKIMEVLPVGPWYNEVVLVLSEAVTAGTILSVFPSEYITDCAGNHCSSDSIQVAIPQAVEKKDLLINELLFDPDPGLYDYAELCNVSEKVLDIQGMAFAKYDTLTAIAYEMKAARDKPLLLFPGQYLLVCSDTAGLTLRYPGAPKPKCMITSELPAMAAAEGTLALIRFSDREIIDAVFYSSSMHYPLLYTTQGVALERIEGISNTLKWHSAGELCHFGTPGYRNSQYVSPEASDALLSVFPKTIIPDNNGVDDITVITLINTLEYEAADLMIYDKNGYKIKVLHNNLLLSACNREVWDGRDAGGNIVTCGIYVLIADLRDCKGNKKRIRTTIGVGQ